VHVIGRVSHGVFGIADESAYFFRVVLASIALSSCVHFSL
jgi:hypothetical protein